MWVFCASASASLARTLPEVLGVAVSILLLLAGITAALYSKTRVGRLLWRTMLAGVILGGVLAQVKYADGECSWIVGWPFVVTRFDNVCADVEFTSGPYLLARMGDIGVAMAAAFMVGGPLMLIRRKRPVQNEP
jgi:hypothetical protein